jgi:hypothetical protein
VNWLSAGGTLRRWFSTRRCLCILTYLGHFTNLCRSLFGGRAPPIPNCLGRFSNKGLATFAAFSGACDKSLNGSHQRKNLKFKKASDFRYLKHRWKTKWPDPHFQNHIHKKHAPFSSPLVPEQRSWEYPSWEPANRKRESHHTLVTHNLLKSIQEHGGKKHIWTTKVSKRWLTRLPWPQVRIRNQRGRALQKVARERERYSGRPRCHELSHLTVPPPQP